MDNKFEIVLKRLGGLRLDMLATGYDTIIDALEKQISKKILVINNHQYCPVCEEKIQDYYAYCPHCGQAIGKD